MGKELAFQEGEKRSINIPFAIKKPPEILSANQFPVWTSLVFNEIQ